VGLFYLHYTHPVLQKNPLPSLRELALVSTFVASLYSAKASELPAVAPRFAVPILCTDSQLGARTRTRGTAVIVSSTGIIVTAAHVVSGSQPPCKLTAVIPNAEWSRASAFRPFLLESCSTNELLDIALCHIQPIGTGGEWSWVQAARVRIEIPPAESLITITGFTGWGFFPTVVRARMISPRQRYRRQDGCYCDFAVDAVTHEGMSGSPLVTEEGDVIGLITTAGSGKFRGISFGTTFEGAAAFLRKAGLLVPPIQK